MRTALIVALSGAALSAGLLASAAPAQADRLHTYWAPVEAPPPTVYYEEAPPVVEGAPLMANAPAVEEEGPTVYAPAEERIYAPAEPIYAPTEPVYGPAEAPMDATSACSIVNQPTSRGWRSVEVCD